MKTTRMAASGLALLLAAGMLSCSRRPQVPRKGTIAELAAELAKDDGVSEDEAGRIALELHKELWAVPSEELRVWVSETKDGDWIATVSRSRFLGDHSMTTIRKTGAISGTIYLEASAAPNPRIEAGPASKTEGDAGGDE